MLTSYAGKREILPASRHEVKEKTSSQTNCWISSEILGGTKLKAVFTSIFKTEY
jgi:hypothetical protein